MIKSKYRGHDIFFIDDQWFYTDNNEPTVGSKRPCGHCEKKITEEGHDVCIGVLPGVMNACCGHGIIVDAYVQFDKTKSISGRDAIAYINKNKVAKEILMSNDKNKIVKNFDKNLYVKNVILPELEIAFAREDLNYKGISHFDSELHMDRSFESDICHVREYHSNVRLLEAEDLASMGKNVKAQDKIISAIGYLIILHARQQIKDDSGVWKAAEDSGQ